MASYNKVFLMGNLTRDPQVKHLPSQMVVAEFGLAVNRRYKTATGEDKEEVAFVDCTAFGRQAETISQYCTRGRPIFVEGRLKFDTWEDKGGAGKRSKLTVVVGNCLTCGSRVRFPISVTRLKLGIRHQPFVKSEDNK
jgi:single-strand DNA-binding protein